MPPPDELTTTTTIQTTSTVTVTIQPFPTNGTMTQPPRPSPPSPTGPGSDPANIGDFAFLGCFGSENGFPTFQFAGASPDMTPEYCVDACQSQRYAAVHADQCLCADFLDPRTRALGDLGECDIPCPGDASESCGGLLSSDVGGFSVSPLRLVRRVEGQSARPASDYLVSLYGVVGGGQELPKPAPPMGDIGAGPGGRPGPGSGGWGVITVPYVTVCPTDLARLITTEYCYTPSPCDDGCDAPPAPPMRTFVEHCEACGPDGESDVTLTVPAGPTRTPDDQLVPSGGPPPEIWSPPVGGVPTGFVQVDGGVAVSMGVAIVLPIAVAIMRLIM